MGRPRVDFNKLMEAYNKRFGKDYTDVAEWLSVLRKRLSIRAMARIIKVDRAVSVSDIGHRIWERTRAPAYKGKGIPDVLQSTVWAKTEKHAIKIVNEYRTQMIATGKWE